MPSSKTKKLVDLGYLEALECMAQLTGELRDDYEREDPSVTEADFAFAIVEDICDQQYVIESFLDYPLHREDAF